MGKGAYRAEPYPAGTHGGCPRAEANGTVPAGVRAHNFSAGPAMLDTNVMTYIQQNLLNYEGCGMGIHEMSHRDVGGAVHEMMRRTAGNVRRLLRVPDNYRILFFQGGAHGQFAAVPMNLFGKSAKADYVIGGSWSKKAMAEASKYGEVRPVADTTENGCTYYPPREDWDLSDDAVYVHICTNETIEGLAMHEDPDVGPDRILVSDMTSSLFSRPVDVSKYGVIYASGGKNLGPAGCCLVIVRDDLLEQSLTQTPSILSWKVANDHDCLYYTPNAFAIWCLEAITRDLETTYGDLETVEKRSVQRAKMVYDVIDGSGGFYTNHVKAEFRSQTAIPFRIYNGNKELETKFVRDAYQLGLLQTVGHTSVGGLRVAVYNGLPDESLQLFVNFMKQFSNSNKRDSNFAAQLSVQSMPAGRMH